MAETKTSLQLAEDKLREGAAKPKDKKLVGEQCKIAAIASGHSDEELKLLSDSEREELSTLVDAHPRGHMLVRSANVFWKTVRQRRADAAKKQSDEPAKKHGLGGFASR